MANYVMAGYTTPAGVTDAAGVKKMQQMLGVKADGVWGPQTQRAYNARMDGISDSYYPNNEKNARMRGVSAPYHSNSTQYQNIRGISDPYFSGGDSYVVYTDYLNERAEKAKSAAADEPVIKTKVIQKLAQEDGAQEKPDWAGYVSPFLPGASTLGTGQNPWGGSMPYMQVTGINTDKSEPNESMDGYIGRLDSIGGISGFTEAYGGVVGNEALEIAGKGTSLYIDAIKLAAVMGQDMHDEDKKLGLPTLTTAAGIFGGIIGGAVGGLAGPVGAYAGSYIGSELLSELAEEIYYAEPVPYGEALERARKYSSPYLPWYDPSKYLE